MSFISWPSIEAFKNLIVDVKRYCNAKAKPLPSAMEFTGSIKIDGTNASVHINDTAYQAYSRSRAISIGSDNMGFAAFAAKPEIKELLRSIVKICNLQDATIFGEFAGIGIQKGVGVSNFPKHFVIFGYYNHDIPQANKPFGVFSDLSAFDIAKLNSYGVFFVNQIPTYTLVINFNDLQPAAELIEQYTVEVENACPWTTFLCGYYGKTVECTIGEGIVWHSVTPDGDILRFKSKGLKHKQTKHGLPSKILSTEVVQEIDKLVEVLLPEWRLRQGINELRSANVDLLPHNTGQYLQWICRDILKEEEDVIVASGLDWKQINKNITNKARQYYFQEINGDTDGLVNALSSAN